jgi:hypothetical protein
MAGSVEFVRDVVRIAELERGAESHRSDLNRRPLDYESSALPLSYCGR